MIFKKKYDNNILDRLKLMYQICDSDLETMITILKENQNKL